MLDQLLCAIICSKISVTTIKYDNTTAQNQPNKVLTVNETTKRPQVIRDTNKRTGDTTADNNPTKVGRNVSANYPVAVTATNEPVIASIRKHFGTEANEAISVATCESGLRSNAVSHTYDYGVFQINRVHFGKIKATDKVAWLFEPENNIRLAKQLYDRQGWRPWSASGRCHGLA